MAKFDPKKADLNKDGKLSDYEENVGKKRAAAMKMGHSPKKMKHSPMEKSPMYNYKKGYAMKMGSKEIDSPSAFSMKDAANMAASPMMVHKAGHEGDLKPGQTMEMDEVTGFSDPLFTQKKYKKALEKLGKDVTRQVRTQYSRDSMMSNLAGNEYQSGKFGNLRFEGKQAGGSKYNIGLAHGDSRSPLGQSPRMFAYDKKGSGGIKRYAGAESGYTEVTKKGNLRGFSSDYKSPSLVKELNKYQKLSDSLFKEGKKSIDLKFFGSKK
tara:strand:+ start:348 stop:1148 length:801 start_codon:yes stop_codon:yes gene_type:complete